MSIPLGSFYSKALITESAASTNIEIWSKLLADNESELIELAINKAFLVPYIQVTQPCRVRIYTNATNRNNDLNRDNNTAVSINAGVCLDSTFNIGELELEYTPAVNIINSDKPQSSIAYITLTNYSGVATKINLVLYVVPLLPINKPEWVTVKRTIESGNDSNPYKLVAGQSYLLEESSRSVKPLRGSFKVYTLGDDTKVDNEFLEPYHYYEFIYSDDLGEWVKINFKKRPRSLSAGEATNSSSMILSGRFLYKDVLESNQHNFLKKTVVSNSFNRTISLVYVINYYAKVVENHIPVDQVIN